MFLSLSEGQHFHLWRCKILGKVLWTIIKADDRNLKSAFTVSEGAKTKFWGRNHSLCVCACCVRVCVCVSGKLELTKRKEIRNCIQDQTPRGRIKERRMWRQQQGMLGYAGGKGWKLRTQLVLEANTCNLLATDTILTFSLWSPWFSRTRRMNMLLIILVSLSFVSPLLNRILKRL